MAHKLRSEDNLWKLFLFFSTLWVLGIKVLRLGSPQKLSSYKGLEASCTSVAEHLSGVCEANFGRQR